MAREREILKTIKHNDWPGFADLLADDVLAIDEDGIVGKKELIDGIKTAGTIFSDYTMGNSRRDSEREAVYVAHLHPFTLGTAWGQVANEEVSGFDGEMTKSEVVRCAHSR